MHQFEMNNIERTWTEPNGWMVMVCSCGVKIGAWNTKDLVTQQVEHIRSS